MVTTAVNSVYKHPNGKTYLSFSEVGRRCKVRAQTVRSWVKKGLLATHVVMGHQMVEEDNLAAFMEPQALEKGTLLKKAVAAAD
jgi:hypothetical protein